MRGDDRYDCIDDDREPERSRWGAERLLADAEGIAEAAALRKPISEFIDGEPRAVEPSGQADKPEAAMSHTFSRVGLASREIPVLPSALPSPSLIIEPTDVMKWCASERVTRLIDSWKDENGE